jgi:hypothetical protein
MPLQTISDVYIDPELLKALPLKLFGREGYRVQVNSMKIVFTGRKAPLVANCGTL